MKKAEKRQSEINGETYKTNVTSQDKRNFWKIMKRFQNSTDRIEIQQSQPLAWRKEGQKVTLVAVIGGFRSDVSITRKTDGNFGNVSVGVLFSKENGGKLK